MITRLLPLAALFGACKPPTPVSTEADADTDTDTDADTDSDADTDVPATTVELFGPTPHTALRVVLHHRPGAEPRAGALQRLREALASLETSGHLVKPGGITVEVGTVLAASADPDAVHAFAELDADLEGVRGAFVDGDAAVVHGLYSDGAYDTGGEGTVLGFAYGGARLVMMRDAIDAACDDPVLTALPGGLADDGCDTLEAGVLLHELGHLFGLVDNGLAMTTPHIDTAHGHHDFDDGCLMYWAAETPAFADTIGARLLGGQTEVPSFDAACLADMAAALE